MFSMTLSLLQKSIHYVSLESVDLCLSVEKMLKL